VEEGSMSNIIIVSDTVKARWAGRTKDYYVALGYKYTKQGDTFDVAVEHLSAMSHVVIDVRCPVCGVVHPVRKYNITIQGNTMCQPCAVSGANFKGLEVGDRFGRLVVVGISDRRGNDGQYYYDCECECGETITTQRHSLVSGLTRSCGCLQREAASEISSAMVGPLNPMWDDTLTDADRRDRKRMYNGEYRGWRRSVLERDRYMCACCDGADNLHVHHIRSYIEHQDIRCDIDNGITLCPECHMKFHSRYGKSGFTEYDMIDFIMDN
jgi:hypothetical protein